MTLQDKHAFITGGGTGIGLAIAQDLAAKGARVTITGRRQEVLEATAAEIDAGGEKVQAVSVDIGDRAAVGAAFETVIARWGRLAF